MARREDRSNARTRTPRQQAFLEAHEKAFAYFGGVFERLRYDNLGSAVKKILRGTATGRDAAVRGFPLALGLRS